VLCLHKTVRANPVRRTSAYFLRLDGHNNMARKYMEPQLLNCKAEVKKER